MSNFSPHSYKVDSEVLRLAHEIVSDPETRAKIKAALEEEGKPGMSALIDEAVVVARELIRLAELQRDGPNDGQDTAILDWLQQQSNGMLWISRVSTTGRGYRVHTDPSVGMFTDVRAAIISAMRRDEASKRIPATGSEGSK